MYDSGKIIPGLIIFVLFITFPVWYNHGDAGAVPKPEKPKVAKKCVLPVAQMRDEHMQVLIDWRNEVLRQGEWGFIKIDGKPFQRSLQDACLKCHTNKKKFCDTCHTYAAVNPYCWDCHFARVKK